MLDACRLTSSRADQRASSRWWGCRGSLTIRDSVRRNLRCSYAAHAGVSAGISSDPAAGDSKNVATITVSPPVGL